MHSLSPADELAEVRAEIARLKAREARLRTYFLTAPLSARAGRWSRIVVEETRSNRFNPSLLPADIRSDATFTELHLVQSVRCLPLPLTTIIRPGWPITHVGSEMLS